MPTSPIAVGIVLPPISFLAPERSALSRDEGGVDLVRLKSFVNARDGRLERGGGHLLVALFEELAHLDQAGADHRHPVPHHYDVTSCRPTTGRALNP